MRDGFIFSDFLAFSMALKQKGIGGDFWSCFPLDEHFDYLGSLNPPIMDIKFGKFGPIATRRSMSIANFRISTGGDGGSLSENKC